VNLRNWIWAAVSVALAFAINVLARPHVEASYERGGAQEPQLGTLTLSDPSLEIPTGAVHVVAEDLPHLGKVYELREISLRSQAARGGVPSFELFVTLPDRVHAIPGRAIDPNELLQLELAVQLSGRLGARESFVQREAAQAGPVLTGTWQFTDVREVWDTGAAELQADARVELQVENARGVDMLTGRWTGRLLLQ
jgi:hypothetical protein